MLGGINPLMMAQGFASFSTVYTASPGTYVEVLVPAGATSVTAECIGGGGNSQMTTAFSVVCGGGGGGYAKRNSYSLAGVSSVWIRVGPNNAGSDVSTIVRATSNVGTVIAEANPGERGNGFNANGGTGVTGDVLTTGGTRSGNSITGAAAAGPGGLGVAPAGGTSTGVGNNYGGGGGTPNGVATNNGAQGWIQLTWN